MDLERAAIMQFQHADKLKQHRMLMEIRREISQLQSRPLAGGRAIGASSGKS